jgi:acetyl-CoA acetyltransferase
MSTRASLVGIGESRVGRIPGRSSLQLQADAATAALSDAGLTMRDVDGLMTTPLRVERWNMPAGVVAHHLGIKPNYLSTVDLAGASGVAMISQAVQAVEAGLCETVLCVAGQNLLSHRSRDDAVKSMAEGGSAHPQFEVPYGPLVPSLYALIAQRHMYEYGTTPEQLAEVAVAIRFHASLNPNAHKTEPLSVADVVGSRMITSPLHVLDCAIVSDGAAAVIVTTRERARDLKTKPVYLLGQGFGLRHSHIGEHKALTTTGAVESGAAAFRSAGVSRADIDVAQIYDCFTITVIVELEDLGFCPKGEGGRFVEGGRIRLNGELPVTTHGGLLSGGHPGLPGGFFHVVEAVRQLRRAAGARQVDNAELALVHGNGGVASVHGTLILGRELHQGRS